MADKTIRLIDIYAIGDDLNSRTGEREQVLIGVGVGGARYRIHVPITVETSRNLGWVVTQILSTLKAKLAEVSEEIRVDLTR